VVILDDMHSADTPSIVLLRFVARQLADMRLVLIGTYRDIELTPDHPMTDAIQEMSREHTTHAIALHGMSETEVGRLIEVATGRPARPSMATRLWRETGGNPLFVGEAVRLLAAEGRLDDEASASRVQLTLPSGVREVITRRAEQLTTAAGRVLRNAAAIGPEFNAELLARLDSGASDPSDALAEAQRAGLVVSIGGGRYRFSHDLVREAIYEDIDERDLAALHKRIAEALESTQSRAASFNAAELAYHYFKAAEGRAAVVAGIGPDIAQKAYEYARLAGDQAAAALAYEEASRLYQMTLAALDLTGAPDDVGRTELLLRWGEIEGRAGDIDSTREIFLKAATLARSSGQPVLLARAALGYSGRLPWARPGNDTRVVPLLQEALLLLGGEDDQLRVRLLTRLACSWRSSPEQRELSDALSFQAVGLARRLDDPPTLGYALIGRFYATWWPHNAQERGVLANEIAEMATRLGDGELLVEANLLVWLSLTELGRMTEARRRADEVRRLAADLRQPAHMWLGVGGTRVPEALLSGDFARAATLMTEESELGHSISIARDEVSAYRFHLFLLHRETGGQAEIEPLVRASVSEFPWYPCHRAAHILTLLDIDRAGEARAGFVELARDDFGALYRDNQWLLGMGLASEACGRLGDKDAADLLFEQLAPFTGRHAMGHAEGSVGALDRYLGILCAVAGRHDDAERYFIRALDQNEQMGARPWRVHTQVDYSRALRQRGGPGDAAKAEELDVTALATAESIGMTVLADELRSTARVRASQPVELPTVGAAHAAFRRDGEYWSIVFDRDDFKLRDSKGLQYLATLLAEPGREFLALELAREALAQELRPNQFGDAGSQLDAEAKSAYRSRLHELQEELDDAEAANNMDVAEKARGEMDYLARELSRAVGLAGRDRAAGSASERARLSVTRAIRLALGRIAEHSPSLGDHLNSTIRTGTYCSYRPDTRVAIDWQT